MPKVNSRAATDRLLDASVAAAREEAARSSAQVRFGKVTAVDATGRTLTCSLDGSTLYKVPYMASYSPSVNDTVWLLVQGSQFIALGKN